MAHFSYKGGCGIHECMRIMVYNRRIDLGYCIDKWAQVISNTMLF